MNDELHELFEKYLHDELDDGTTSELIEQLEQPEHRRKLVEHVQWSAMITRGARQLAGRMASLQCEVAPSAASASETGRTRVLRPVFRYALAAVGSAAATIIVILGLQHAAVPPATNDPVAEPAGIAALQLSGAKIHVVRNGDTFIARDRMPIRNGDLLEATGGGISSVHYHGENTFVRLHTGTQATFSKQATGSKHIHLLRGRIAASVSPQPDGYPMEVTALHTRATVLGTRFALAVNEERTQLGVESGSVRLTHRETGGTVDVDAGYSASGAESGLSGPALDVDFLPTLRGHWAFDDRGGTVAMDSSLSFCDARLEGCDWTDGRLGSALRFTALGGSAEVESAQCGNFGSASFTLSLWIRPELGVGDASLLHKRDTGGAGYALSFHQGERVLAFTVSDAENTLVALSNRLQLMQNRWYHVVAALDRGANRLVLQLNGRTIASSPCVGLAANIDSSEPLVMGADGTYAGALDDVRLYSGVLTPVETADLQRKVGSYSAGPAGTTIFIE